MKRLTAGLLALMLLSLLSGCGKKEQWSVDNFFLSDDGTTYSVSYRHDDGTQELIAEMGSYPQPLTIVSGKLYFVRGGSMVAVDLKDPTAGCRPCPDYGRYWTCPPYDVPAAEYWGRYETVLLRGMQFHFTRELLERRGTLRSLAATEEDSVYRLYYDFEQSLSHLQGHQILAINRGEKEDKLKVSVGLDRELALQNVRRAVIKPGSRAMAFVRAAADDAYDRLIWPSMERETRAALTDTACEGAIKMFALNLRPLLMQPPVKGKVIKMADVPDPVFGGEVLGKGCAVWPEDDLVYAPCDGKVTVTMGHAVGLQSDSGIEVLVHVGVDTVNMNGDGFEGFVKADDVVKAGQPILKIDRAKIAAAGYKDCVVVAVSNTAEFADVELTVEAESAVAAGDAIVKVVRK